MSFSIAYCQSNLDAKEKENIVVQKKNQRSTKGKLKIKVEDYQGDLENLPEGAFLKKETRYNVKTAQKSTQTFVILPRKDD